MPRLRRLSGPEVITIFERFGFRRAHQRGSHVRLTRMTATGQHQALTVPEHRQLKPGTLRAILSQASQFIAVGDLHPWFYTE